MHSTRTGAPQAAQSISSLSEQAEPSSLADSIVIPPTDPKTGKVFPLDPAQHEIRPKLGPFHPSFALAESGVRKVIETFLEIYDEQVSEGYGNDALHKVVEKRLRPFADVRKHHPPSGPVACLGSAGDGKSTTTNNVLGSETIAPESGGNTRGTSVPHEYISASPQQTDRFVVTAVTPKDITTVVSRHVDNIITYNTLNRKEWEEGEDEEYLRKHHTGLTFFVTLLPHTDGFASKEDAEGVFRDLISSASTKEQLGQDIEEMKERLNRSIEASMREMGFTSYQMSYPANSAGELMNVFSTISRPGRNHQDAHPWVLLSKVVISQHSDLHGAGIIWADLPGIGDSNLTIVESMRAYLKTAGTVLAFVNHLRCATNENFDAMLMECIQLRKMHNTVAVVTKIDNQNPLTDAERMELPEADCRSLESAERELAVLKDKSQEVFTKKMEVMRANDFQAFMPLEFEYQKLQRLIPLLDAKILQIQIGHRNRDAAMALKGKFRALTNSKHAPDLRVIFVGNQAHQSHRKGYDVSKPLSLDLQATGILELCCLLLESTVAGQMQKLSLFTRKNYPHTFRGIVGLLTKTKMEMKEQVELLLENALSAMQGLVASVEDALETSFQSHIVAALGLLPEARTMEDNRKINEDEDKVDWVMCIHKVLDAKLAPDFDLLVDDVRKAQTEAVQRLQEVFTQLQTELEECPGFAAMRDFSDYATDSCEQMTIQIAELFGELSNVNSHQESLGTLKTSLIWVNSTDDVAKSSFVQAELRSTFAACERLNESNLQQDAPQPKRRKTGGCQRSKVHMTRVELLRQKLNGTSSRSGERGLLPKLADMSKELFQDILVRGYQAEDGDHVKPWIEILRKVIDDGAEEIRNNFHERFAEEGVKEEENHEAVDAILRAANEALDQLKAHSRRMSTSAKHLNV